MRIAPQRHRPSPHPAATHPPPTPACLPARLPARPPARLIACLPACSIDAKGTIGAISRPGRPGLSCACSALNAALVDIKRDGLTSNCKIPGGG